MWPFKKRQGSNGHQSESNQRRGRMNATASREFPQSQDDAGSTTASNASRSASNTSQFSSPLPNRKNRNGNGSFYARGEAGRPPVFNNR